MKEMVKAFKGIIIFLIQIIIVAALLPLIMKAAELGSNLGMYIVEKISAGIKAIKKKMAER